ncbi:MAG TPA: cupin-like domain-containing protein [Acidimicrobiales bacterium]|jgi:lysine-specific demethylase 8
MPGIEDFLREYVFRRRPVVITDLFATQEIAGIATVEDALETWGAMPIQLQEEYTAAEGKDQPDQPVVMEFAEYVELIRTDPSTRLCCTEYETPARVLATFRLPGVCTASAGADADEIFGLPKKYGDFDLTTNTFIGNVGNVAHLHFDGDQRQVFLHEVYGRKRVVLFDPPSARHLRTLDGPYSRPSLAGLYLEAMDTDEKLEQIARADGYHTILEPGETIYIPMLAWHHVEYLDDAMSVNLRFGRTSFGRFLSLDNFHRDPFIQNVASKMVGPADALRSFAPLVEQVKATYRRPARDMTERIRLMRALFRDLCAHVTPEAVPDELCPTEREEEQVERIVRSNDLRGGLKYADPDTIARTRPVGPVSDRQLEILRDGITTAGYSKEIEHAVMFNRFGKSELSDLSRAEAAQLLGYLRTPGASW